MDHAILLGNLKLYGVSSQSLNWFRSYLSGRKQQTFIDGVQSDFCNIICSIPQRSILGPLLFSIYVNDLPSCNLFSKPRMYADDTTLTTSAEDPCVLEHKMNYDMNLIQSWLSANKLTLNVKKTKYMLIGSQFKLSQINSDFTVKVNNTPLERVIKHKSLGVQIDESLSWCPHINSGAPYSWNMVNLFLFGCDVIERAYVRTYASTDCTGGVRETIKRKGGVPQACFGKSTSLI